MTCNSTVMYVSNQHEITLGDRIYLFSLNTIVKMLIIIKCLLNFTMVKNVIRIKFKVLNFTLLKKLLQSLNSVFNLKST